MTGFLLPHGNKWHKIVFGLESVNFCDFFAVSTTTNSRGHQYKLFKPRCTASIRQKVFGDRVINVWNALQSAVNLTSLNVFGNSIEKTDFSSFLVSNILPVVRGGT